MNTNLAREEVVDVVDNVIPNIHALPTVTKETTRFRQGEALGYKILKRIVDIIGALFGIIMLVPMTIGIYIANLIVGDNGPIFYSQNRIGKDGKIFKMYKFRSMVMGADEKLEKYLEENEEARKEYKINKKLKDDPRVTKIGKFIRKTSIDEFPQFVNVLKGDMSLVGPRPYLPREIDDMGKAYPYITAVKPGVTGLWQVSGRNDVTFEERLDLDIQYYKQKGIKSDMKLLGKTVKKVAFKEGAR
ncbi:undecaprenyl-phosphate galactosephosphotransferase [Clostridium sp. CAG:356]|nr:undecaprenyl-phosphate galactosephosphotransferase [Clostridium sp. CAG:356]